MNLCYAVTDIETDGPEPGKNSMLSFASVAVSAGGEILSQFEANLAPLPGAAPFPATTAWFETVLEVYADITRDPQAPKKVSQDYANWLRALAAPAVFTANPLSYDGFWIDWYLRKFLDHRLAWGPLAGEPLFFGTGLDIPSLLMGRMGWSYEKCRRENCPKEWFGGIPHSHRAIDDALG